MASKPRPAEEVLGNLVFELNNSKRIPEKQRIFHLAETGGIGRADFAKECFRQEFIAAQDTANVYDSVWVPFCKQKGLIPHPTLWGIPLEKTWEERLAKYPPTFWYPWKHYGAIYDKHTAYAEDDFKFNALGSPDVKELLGKAQDKNDSRAQEKLGMAYLNGNGVRQDYMQAFSWFTKAAAQNNTLAQKHLAWMYDNEVGVKQDVVTASGWYLKAANHGDVSAERAVGLRYEFGIGLPKDLSTAVQWYQKAADEGDDQASDHLAYCLLEGRGIDKDQKRGFSYLLRAAKSQAHARYMVAQCYAKGIGVSADRIESYKWCLLSLQMDQEAANLRQTLEGTLTEEQKQKANAEVQQWSKVSVGA